jgi:prepilin-type N-terminal cleavage/methylation domain-containing protein
LAQKTENKGFTLVEIITVIAIIVLLAGMMFPVLSSAINRGKAAHTSGLINRLEGALYIYNSDYRDYPPCAGVGGSTLDDNEALLKALISEKGTNAPYASFNEKDTGTVGGKLVLIDGWRNALSYCSFLQYDPNWETNQAWRWDMKKYEIQIISGGTATTKLDADHDLILSNSELDGLNGSNLKKIVKNW